MLIRAGFEITLTCGKDVPLLCALSPYPGLVSPVLGDGAVHSRPRLPLATYADAFGNRITRVTAPGGRLVLTSDFVVQHSGETDPVVPGAQQHPIEELPPEVLRYLVASRYCELDLLGAEAWARFGPIEGGWARVQAVCDFVHRHITFGYQHGRPTKTALDAFREGNGVCRDFAQLSIALCRALNIPARYASGYLGDIGVPYGGPMDFCAWFEVWLGGRWYTFDARYNIPRIGRIVMVRGLDAADVSMITSYGAHRIERFEVWCDEVPSHLGIDDLRGQLRVAPVEAVAA